MKKTPGLLILFAGLITLALICAARPAVAQTPARFVQDRFVIGMWVDPPVDEKVEARYKELAEANFTMVIANFEANTPEKTARVLDLCRKYDLKALVSSEGVEADKLPDSPACWGYQVQDEPHVKDFPKLASRVAAIRKARPGKLAYINLYPDEVALGAIGTNSYEEYLGRYLKEVNPDLLSMDSYPLFTPESDGRETYCRNLSLMRRYSLQTERTFWNWFNAMPYRPHTDPTEAQLRWQIYAALTYGSKGVMYFCYTSPGVGPGSVFTKGGAIIDTLGRKTRHYEQAKRLNAELRNLGPTLMQLTSTYILHLSPTYTTDNALENTPIRSISHEKSDPPQDYLIGAFGHKDGRRAVMIQNYRFAYTAWPTVEFDADPVKVTEVDKATGKEGPARDDSPDMPGLQISLDAGEGRLFLLPPK